MPTMKALVWNMVSAGQIVCHTYRNTYNIIACMIMWGSYVIYAAVCLSVCLSVYLLPMDTPFVLKLPGNNCIEKTLN